MKNLPDFKNRTYDKLTNAERIAMAERVAMDHCEYLKSQARNTAGFSFLDYWQNNIGKIELASASDSMRFYVYSDTMGLCLVDSSGALSSVKYNTKENICFINNVINPIGFNSPIVERLKKGMTIEEIEDKGIDVREYGNQLPNARGTKGKIGKPVDPNSRSQRIKRGEITFYEAYQKKPTSEDAL